MLPSERVTHMTNSNNLPGLPIVAIMRGIQPDEIIDICNGLVSRGIRRLEVPLNSPDAFRSIQMMKDHFPADVLIGAGTVMETDQVRSLANIGCDLIVAPNFDPDVVAATKSAGMISCPGVFTPSEAFAALKAGADILKYFPAELNGPPAIKAWRAVLPKGTQIMATGGTNADTLAGWMNAGVDMVGVGSALYKPGRTTADVIAGADALVQAYHEIGQNND